MSNTITLNLSADLHRAIEAAAWEHRSGLITPSKSMGARILLRRAVTEIPCYQCPHCNGEHGAPYCFVKGKEFDVIREYTQR